MKSTFDKYLEGKKKRWSSEEVYYYPKSFEWNWIEQAMRESRDIGYKDGAEGQAILDAGEIKKAVRVKDKVRLAWAKET